MSLILCFCERKGNKCRIAQISGQLKLYLFIPFVHQSLFYKAHYLFSPQDHVPEDFKPVIPRLYTVGLGMGYLELPQVSGQIFSKQLYCEPLFNMPVHQFAP